MELKRQEKSISESEKQIESIDLSNIERASGKKG